MKAVRYAVWVVGTAWLALLVPVVAGLSTTSYGGAAPWRLWLEAGAAVGLLVVASADAGHRRQSLAAGIAGASWLVPELAGWPAGPSLLVTSADAWSRMLPAVVLAAVVADGGRRLRALITLAVFGGAIAAAARLLLVDPFLDVSCWRRCDHNTLLVAHTGLGRGLDHAGCLLVAASAVCACALAIRDRHRVGLSAAVAAVLLTAGTAGPGALRLVAAESGTSAGYLSLFVAAQLGAIALALALVHARLLQWRLRTRLVRLSGNLSATDAPSVTDALRRAARDPHLQVRYWAVERSLYVDADGCPVDPPQSDTTHRVTFVNRRGQPVAALVHARDVDGGRLDRALGPALRLVLENERLRAAALAELHELRDSRARIVERAALERRRLERNLHDGAQQRVVSLSLLVRMAAGRVEQDPAAAAFARRAASLTEATVQELRRVARGIHPAVVGDAGLAGALLDLAESSADVAVRVDGVPSTRYGGTAETTAYVTVAEALADARRRDASALTVCGRVHDGILILDMSDDAAPAARHSVLELADQVEALGGSLVAEPWHRGTRVHLELPCGS
jgi:signal transduction histidine kinase